MEGDTVNDQHPTLTPKGHSVLQVLKANPGMTVAEAIEVINGLTGDIEAAFEETI